MALSLRVSILAVLAIAGCGPTARITSNRAPSYMGNIQKIFLLSRAGEEGELSSVVFRAAFITLVNKCGIEAWVHNYDPLSLDPDAPLQQLKSFAPDVFMTLVPSGGTKNQYGAITQIYYDAKLMDVATEAVVWRAHINLVPGAPQYQSPQAGKVLATQLLGQLKDDLMLQKCAGVALELPIESPRPRRR